MVICKLGFLVGELNGLKLGKFSGNDDGFEEGKTLGTFVG
jgi:hypothetical protein